MPDGYYFTKQALNDYNDMLEIIYHKLGSKEVSKYSIKFFNKLINLAESRENGNYHEKLGKRINYVKLNEHFVFYKILIPSIRIDNEYYEYITILRLIHQDADILNNKLPGFISLNEQNRK